LPLLFDDLLHIRITKSLDFVSVWLPSTEFGWFRPLVFLPLLIIKGLFGHYPPPLLHALNLIQQMGNVFLITVLSWRLWRSWIRAVTAGALLACFPFAYQAIAQYGNNIHPFSAGIVLLALHTYLSAIRPNAQRRWWPVTACLFAAGLLSHESVVLFGLFAGLIHWVHLGQGTWKEREWRTQFLRIHPLLASEKVQFVKRKAPFLLFVLVGGLFIIGYQFLPLGASPQVDAGDNEPLLKLLYLMQSVSYPLSWFAHQLPDLSALTIIIGSFGFTLVLSFWAATRPGNRLSLLMGWTWWGLASLVIGLNLPTYYILHGPRLLYLGSIGVVLLWTILLGHLFELPRIGRWIWAIGLGFIVITSWAFVRGRLAAFEDIATPLAIIEKEMAARPAEEGVLLVNLPQWTAPARNTYAAGVEYVTMMGTHLFAEELIAENLGGVYRPTLAITLPDLLADSGYPYGTHSQTQLASVDSDWSPAGSHVFLSRFLETGIETLYAGQFIKGTAIPALATFSPYVLAGAQANFCNDAVDVVLSWDQIRSDDRQASSVSLSTLSGFVQLLDETGRLIAQLDGPPLRLRSDLIQLQPGWRILDRRTIPLVEEGVPTQLLVGIYDFVAAERIPGVDENSVPLQDNAFRVPVTESCVSLLEDRVR
jgi:hypothetical protein